MPYCAGLAPQVLPCSVTDATSKACGRKNDSGESNKYRYEYNGQTMYWSGQGRRPNVIAEAIKAGGSLDDFLISQDTSSCSDYE